MWTAGVLIFTGGLDGAAPVFNVDPSGGVARIADGPYADTDQQLGGFAVVDVTDHEAAMHWATKIALACGWPQEVRRFMTSEVARPAPPAARLRPANDSDHRAHARTVVCQPTPVAP